MRRPLKPFVTEYKGSARRGAPVLREGVGSEAPKSAPKPLDLAFPLDVEDSYEAAMRAADALFAPQRAPAPAAPTREPEPAPRLMPAPRQMPALESPAVATPAASPAAPERPVGRILRVLDEAPLPEALALAALEIERAPKRRGRKPGSKNKPKPVVAEAILPAIEAFDAEPEFIPFVARPATPPTKAAVRRVAALPADTAPPAGKNGKKFTWVKDRLRPGEDWKRRRLPKVCW